MRIPKLAGFILSVCSFATPALAQSLTDKMIPSADRARDFGTVARAAKTEHRFEIRNPFPQPLHLKSVSTSCGCTTPSIETEWIQPGEVGTVIARFNTATFSGDRKATISLVIDQPNFMQLQLNVKGYIRSDIVIYPGELNFGTVPQGSSKQIEADVEYAGRADWKLTSISGSPDLISGSITEVSRTPGRVTYKITASLAPGASPGPHAAELILHTNDARLKTVPLGCFVQVEAPLTVSPTHVTLGELIPGKSIEQRLLIKGSTPFQIVDVVVDGMDVQFDPSAEAKPIQFLNVTLAPAPHAATGAVRTRMIIKTDMPGAREVGLDLQYEIPTTNSADPLPLSTKVSSRKKVSGTFLVK